MGVGAAGPHFSGDPNSFHDLFAGSAASKCGAGVSADAVRALRDMRDSDGDQLLRLGVKRAVGKNLLAEGMKAVMRSGREPLAQIV